MELTQEKLKELLDYNPITGEFMWKHDEGRAINNKSAGTTHHSGYVLIGINKKQLGAHRLAYLYMMGTMPAQYIDHINNVKHDNRWSNLRTASHSQNLMNSPKQSNNSSGIVGVGWHKAKQKWFAYINIDGKRKSLKYHNCITAAAIARKKAEQIVFGEYTFKESK